MENPFVFGQVLPPDAPYCPRPALEAALREAAQSNRRIVLLGDRRVGKSSLVERTLRGDRKRVLVTADLLGLNSAGDLVERVRSSLVAALAPVRTLTRHLPGPVAAALDAIASLRISLPFVEAELARNQAATVTELMGHMQRVSEWRPLTVFLDEFQEIPDNLPPAEAKHILGVLRGAIQRQPRIAWIFAGSARDSLGDMFTASTSPFYKSARVLEVPVFPRKTMERFLAGQFERGARQPDPAVLQLLLLLAGDNPNDIQELAYHLWAHSAPGPLRMDRLRQAFHTLLHEVGRAGERVIGEATPSQQRVLYGLALKAGELDVFTSQFLQFAGFATKQAVSRALEPYTDGRLAILEKRAGKVLFRDRYMRLWLTAQLLRNPSAFPPAMQAQGEWLDTVRSLLAPG